MIRATGICTGCADASPFGQLGEWLRTGLCMVMTRGAVVSIPLVGCGRAVGAVVSVDVALPN
jgi:hypothetical protein